MPESFEQLRQDIDAATTPDVQEEVRKRVTEALQGTKEPLKEALAALGIPFEVHTRRELTTAKINAALDAKWTKAIPIVEEKEDTMPTDELDRPLGSGDGSYGAPDEKPRYKLAKEVLREMGIDLKECRTHRASKTPKNTMRQTPYSLIVIPELNKMIHCCDEEGNQTFVIHGTTDAEAYKGKGKKWHYAQANVDDFSWCDPEEWKAKLGHYLNQAEATPRAEREMDADYFKNKDYITMDLLSYVTACDGVESIAELSMSNKHQAQKAECANGERVRWRTYLPRAVRALGLKTAGEALKALKKLAGVEVDEFKEMDKSYFTPSTVKKDLECYVAACGVKSIAELYNSQAQKAKCANGEAVTLQTYSKRAVRALGLKTVGEALKELKKLAGVEEMDKSYFTPSTMKKDLECYVAACGVKSVAELDTSKSYQVQKAECTNGETVRWKTYLDRAARALGLTTTGEALKALKKLAGVEVDEFKEMDKSYFTPSTVKGDLKNYAVACGVKSIAELSTTKEHQVQKAECVNGETVTLQTYSKRAVSALGLKTRGEALKELKKLAGVEVDEFKEMDKSYFTPSTVTKDLGCYVAACGVKSIAELDTSKSYQVQKAECTNGETVKWNTYLLRAAGALGLKTVGEALKELKKLAGVEVKEFKAMDKSYFTPSTVKKDLECYVAACGVKSIAELYTSNQAQKAQCANGEAVKWQAYLRRAVRALGLKTVGEALKELKKLAGIEVE